MVNQAIHLLKQSGDISVRLANDSLRIPGFKQLEGCQTTVDMDADPEVFIMLEPIQIMGRKITLTNDMRKSARRLRSVFTASTSFFQWRLPNGERMLRENGIENIPSQIFDEIRTSLAQSDPHFLKFPAVAIKRCLLLFTKSFLPQTKWAAPGKGNTTAMDFAQSSSSMVAEPPTSPRQEASPSPVIDGTHGPSSSVPQIHSEGRAAPAAPPIPVPSAISREGRGRGRGATESQGGGRASSGRGGKKAGPSRDDIPTPTMEGEPTISDKHTAALGLIQLSCASSSRPAGDAPVSATATVSQSHKPVQQPEASVKHIDVSGPSSKDVRKSSRRKAKASYLAPLDKPTSVDDSRDPSPLSLAEAAGASQGSVPSASFASMRDPNLELATTLGKHPRAQPDLVEQSHLRPTTFRKHHHGVSHDAPESRSEAMERMEGYLAGVKAIMDKQAEQHRVVATSEEILAMRVNFLRERVRNFEEEKTAMLDMQRRQLRPGLVTLKMTPRVQDRVNQLFGSDGKGAGSGTGAPAAQAQDARSISDLPTAPQPKSQNTIGADGTVPPMGFFKRPTGRQESNTSSNMTLVPSSEPEKDGDSSDEEPDYDDDDSKEDPDYEDESSDERSDGPTESSWAATIPP
ncbi:hypothetical protein INS49_007742 [Diaporthe citri]|uniref:uncharacterized protein n=1 Tax=Diaporthe citri TaxID=83186 RepID=UPI001C7F45A2|nr:uncharacterized protein INS49_007742 [Diaporthe citri]KAG6362650.1 hypothetical protein INS49_007742 [Diaporthe citri]